MKKNYKLLFWLSVASFLALIISSFIILCFLSVPVWVPYVPLPFALVGIVCEIIFCILFLKSSNSPKIKAKVISALACFSLSLLAASIFIILFWEGWYGFFPARKIIAVIVPVVLFVTSTIILLTIKPFRRHLSKTANLEQRVAELEQQVDELKKGE